jgi:hypothetical protein
MKTTVPEARLELVLLESRVEDFNGADFDARFLNAGFPPEVTLRLRELWEATCTVGDKVLRIGKIILMELARFAQENQNLAMGVALGAGVGVLVSLVPILGPFLAPLAAAIGIGVGAVVGARMDRRKSSEKGVVGITEEAILIARKFFELFAAIFRAVSSEFKKEK